MGQAAPLYLEVIMLAIIRTIIVIIYTILVCVLGGYIAYLARVILNMMTFGHLFGRLSGVFGIKLIKRIPQQAKNYPPSIYLGNHQNNYDMVTISNGVQPRTVTVGKKV